MANLFTIAAKDFLNGDVSAKIRVDTNLTEDEELKVAYLFRNESNLPEWETKALNECKGKILDVGAGLGCHTKILQNRGFDVTALDISQSCASFMKELGVKKVKCQNFFEHEGNYETLLFLMNGVGMIQTVDKLPYLFEKCKSLLNPGGQVILESSDIIYLFQEEDGSVLLDLNAKYYGEMEYQLSYKNHVEPPFKWLYVGYELLAEAATSTGFSIEKISQSEEGNYLAIARLQ